MDQVVLLKNVRFHKGETKGDADLAKAFAELSGTCFRTTPGASHRAHASVSGIAHFLPSAGLLLEAEVRAFEKVRSRTRRGPSSRSSGAPRFRDKLKVIQNLLGKVDALLVGRYGLHLLAAQGHSIGKSLVESEHKDLCRCGPGRRPGPGRAAVAAGRPRDRRPVRARRRCPGAASISWRTAWP
ncbi:MAG: phosphoglycerate kinase [Planctomycetota bacterium]